MSMKNSSDTIGNGIHDLPTSPQLHFCITNLFRDPYLRHQISLRQMLWSLGF